MTKSSINLENICAQMKAAYNQAETSMASDAPKEIREIFNCINRILSVDLPPRLAGVAFDESGTHIEDKNTRHELRNKMSVISGFADLLVQTKKVEGESAKHLSELTNLSMEFTEML